MHVRTLGTGTESSDFITFDMAVKVVALQFGSRITHSLWRTLWFGMISLRSCALP